MQFLLAEESLSMADIAPLFSKMADISLWRFKPENGTSLLEPVCTNKRAELYTFSVSPKDGMLKGRSLG